MRKTTTRRRTTRTRSTQVGHFDTQRADERAGQRRDREIGGRALLERRLRAPVLLGSFPCCHPPLPLNARVYRGTRAWPLGPLR
jgi:hypothetical protein